MRAAWDKFPLSDSVHVGVNDCSFLYVHCDRLPTSSGCSPPEVRWDRLQHPWDTDNRCWKWMNGLSIHIPYSLRLQVCWSRAKLSLGRTWGPTRSGPQAITIIVMMCVFVVYIYIWFCLILSLVPLVTCFFFSVPSCARQLMSSKLLVSASRVFCSGAHCCFISLLVLYLYIHFPCLFFFLSFCELILLAASVAVSCHVPKSCHVET